MQLARLARGARAGRTLLRDKVARSAAGAAAGDGATSKDEMLALYAAHAPFGGNVVGLEAAAWRYFGRDAGRAVLGGGGDAGGVA